LSAALAGKQGFDTMTTIRRVLFDEPLQVGLEADIRRQIFYIDERIASFSLLVDSDGIAGVDVECPDLSDEESSDLSRKLRSFASAGLAGHRTVSARVIWKSSMLDRSAAKMAEAPADGDLGFQSGEGLMAAGPRMIDIIEFFDMRLRSLMIGSHGAREYRYPTLLPTRVLERSGYLESFPQLAMFASRLHSDLDNYAAFCDNMLAAGGSVEPYVLDYCRGSQNCLPPAMCFHMYHHYQGYELDPRETLALTAQGKAFRFESRYEHGFERLWDFTVRELMFAGTADFVRGCQRRWIAEAGALLDELGLRAFCVTANDPFFAGRHSDKMWSQRLAESKYELQMEVGDGRTIAVASFNYAGDFFARRFGLTFSGGGPVTSGCVGFGLERLAYAFLCQYGLSKDAWPPQVAAFKR